MMSWGTSKESRVAAKNVILHPTNRTVRGIVQDPQGKPVSGAVITAKRSGGRAFPGTTVSDASGQYVFENLDESELIYLFARVPGRGWIDETSTVHPGQNEMTIKVGPSHYD
jgi:hypothetical protein